ncbi:MAG: hypothetical protein GXO48_03125 [Chlorobi bacterium]|nr:hypothetical protein [Chlorobiota bacterium]
MKIVRLTWLFTAMVIVISSLTTMQAQNKREDDLDFILKDDKEPKGFVKNIGTSLRFGLPVSFSPLPDSIKFSTFNSLGTGIYTMIKLELTENFSLAFSPTIWFHKVGYKPSAKRVFPSIDSNNTLEKLRTTSLGLSIEIHITVAKDNKGRPGFVIAPGFEADFPIVQTLKKKYILKTPTGSSYDVVSKTIGLNIFYPYRYAAYLLVGHRDIGVRFSYWFTPWFKLAKYNIVNGVPEVSETGTRSLPPVSQFEVGIYLGL